MIARSDSSDIVKPVYANLFGGQVVCFGLGEHGCRCQRTLVARERVANILNSSGPVDANIASIDCWTYGVSLSLRLTPC